MVRARSHGSAMLECDVEAYPKPELHWETRDGRLDAKPEKYRVQEEEYRRDYKVRGKRLGAFMGLREKGPARANAWEGLSPRLPDGDENVNRCWNFGVLLLLRAVVGVVTR